MKELLYGFYWSRVWIGLCFLAFAGRLFSPEGVLGTFLYRSCSEFAVEHLRLPARDSSHDANSPDR